MPDTKRVIKIGADVVRALKAAPPAWDRWLEYSPSHKREHAKYINEAKRPETRARRIEATVRTIRVKPARTRVPDSSS